MKKSLGLTWTVHIRYYVIIIPVPKGKVEKKIQTLQITVYPRLKEIDNNNPWHRYKEFSSKKSEQHATLKDRSGERFCFV